MILMDKDVENITKTWKTCVEQEWNTGKNRLTWVTELNQEFLDWMMNFSFQRVVETEGIETYFYAFSFREKEGKVHNYSCFYYVLSDTYSLPIQRDFSETETETAFFNEAFSRLRLYHVCREIKYENID